MDDVTASIIIACQTAGAVNSINKLGFAMGMLGRKAMDFMSQSLESFNSAQDASWKFGKTFANSMGTATKAVREFMEEYNLSEQTAKKMLEDTASTLKGFGFNEKDALKMSEQVSRMGIDLASFTGVAGGAKEAVSSITAAMTGEGERMKKYGTVIRMNGKEMLSLVKTIMKNKGASETMARAEATLQEIINQNKDAIGDYKAEGENWTQAQNDQKEAMIELKDTIGSMLYEILDIYPVSQKMIDRIKLITETIKTNSSEWIYKIKSFINIMRGGFELIWTVAKNAFSNVAVVGKYVWESLVQAWSDAPGFFGAVWEDIKNIADNTWNFIIDMYAKGILGWADILKSFLRNWKGIFGDMWKIVITSLKSIGIVFWEHIKNIGKLAASLGENFWDLITGGKTFSEAVGGVFDTYWKNALETQRKVAKQWEGFEFSSDTKNFSQEVVTSVIDVNKKLWGGSFSKLIGEAGKNTERYLAQNGIRMGEFTSITDGIDGVIDAYGRRQREIDARRGFKPEEPKDKPTRRQNVNDEQFIASLKSIADSVNGFRNRSQSEILANSVEALRLQSRVFTQSPEIRIQERQLDVLEKIRRGIDKMSSPTRTNPLVSYGGN